MARETAFPLGNDNEARYSNKTESFYDNEFTLFRACNAGSVNKLITLPIESPRIVRYIFGLQGKKYLLVYLFGIY